MLKQIRKEFGEQAMFILGQNERLLDLEVRSSGSILLDMALGGGYAKGRVVSVSGPEKSGKTTLLNLAIAEAQKREPEKKNAIIDLEQAYNPQWAKILGVDLSKLYFSQPDTYAEKVFDMVEYLVKTGEFAYIGLDSIAGLVPKAEFEEEDWDKEDRVGGISKLITKAIRKIVNSGALTHSGTTLFLINQLRDKIGGFSPYGTPTTMPGGRALRHVGTHHLEVATGSFFTKGTGDNKSYLGQQIRVKVTKNKIAPPHRQATLDLYYEYGIDQVMELVQVAKTLNVLSGTTWLTFIHPFTGEVFKDKDGQDIKFNGVNKAREGIIADLEAGGDLYQRIFDVIQEVIRG